MKALPRRLNKPGPLLLYLEALQMDTGINGQEIVEKTIAAVRACLSTPDGAILLDLLIKSTEEYFLAPDADPRACDALNSQRFIALDLRRIVSDEYEKQRLDQKARQSAGRRGR